MNRKGIEKKKEQFQLLKQLKELRELREDISDELSPESPNKQSGTRSGSALNSLTALQKDDCTMGLWCSDGQLFHSADARCCFSYVASVHKGCSTYSTLQTTDL